MREAVNYDRKLKAWPCEFEAIAAGLKRAEYRREDGPRFEVNETILLEEWRPRRTGLGSGKAVSMPPGGLKGRRTGRTIRVRVSHVLRGPEWGVPDGMVILSIFVLDDSEPRL